MELISFASHRRKANINKAKKGYNEAFLSLIDENRLNLYRVARGILRNEEDIKDALQNTLVKSFKNISTLQNNGLFKTWLIRILINECNEVLRKNKRNIPLNEEIGESLGGYSDQYKNMDLIRVIDSLSDEYRTIITLFYFEDISVKDISNILGISEGTVKSRLSRAREKIKSKLEVSE